MEKFKTAESKENSNAKLWSIARAFALGAGVLVADAGLHEGKKLMESGEQNSETMLQDVQLLRSQLESLNASPIEYENAIGETVEIQINNEIQDLLIQGFDKAEEVLNAKVALDKAVEELSAIQTELEYKIENQETQFSDEKIPIQLDNERVEVNIPHERQEINVPYERQEIEIPNEKEVIHIPNEREAIEIPNERIEIKLEEN